MSAVTDKTPQGGIHPSAPSLKHARLPKWAPAATAVGAIAVAVGIGMGAELSSKIQWGLIAVLLFVGTLHVLSSKVEGTRQAKDRLATSLLWVCFILAVIPLFSLIEYTIAKGLKVLDAAFLSHSMNGVITTETGGGIYHSLIGTLEQVGIATAMAAPIGLLTAIYLVEYGRGKLAKTVTFFVDVMTGVPSIVAGLFILSFWIIYLDFNFSGFAGAMALAILMMPVVVRSTEEMLKLVPNELREASLALGVPKWLTILRVVLPTAIGGIVTGVMLAIARITGETAPVLLLVYGSTAINNNPFDGPQDSLPLYVFQQWKNGNEPSYDRAWAAALVLIALVMAFNLLARGIARWKAPSGGRG
ncbi:phosphate ABC transporter permease PstA [Wenjunlia tyrosinilytica]|uniref:Phosphate transport system permease protein PstA n=1 Tax=Wenjunlia tyrosinilytica TaxID=1544741 RepID=A0A917ZMM0_9ACTN|nr:phosphate ABC transporter permease PstA [Wenjunlia tyrosinilytica]GGO87333.1 phosphate transport system permease protein PstA [Wenjunlia tyrosinilytica]